MFFFTGSKLFNKRQTPVKGEYEINHISLLN